jgi:hypothetical protein
MLLRGLFTLFDPAGDLLPEVPETVVQDRFSVKFRNFRPGI